MSNIYYCRAPNSVSSSLRAVLSMEQAKCLLKKHSAQYSGQQFPPQDQNQGSDFAVLRIFDECLGDKWRAGFYRFDADIMRIEEAVQACTVKLS
jgi:hypothetical protein